MFKQLLNHITETIDNYIYENRFDVMFTLDGKRDFREFTNKLAAEKFAKQMIVKGATKVFIDIYDNDDDLIDYKYLKENNDGDEELTVTIRGPRGCIDVVKKILASMRYMNNGSSRTLLIGWDGDGSDRLDIISPENLKLDKETANMLGNSNGLHIYPDGLKAKISPLTSKDTNV